MTCPGPFPDYTPRSTFEVTLTCENAVAAATAAVGEDTTVTTIEFHFGLWCQPNYPCPAMGLLNGGYVIFHRSGGSDIVVIVQADDAGNVTVVGRR